MDISNDMLMNMIMSLSDKDKTEAYNFIKSLPSARDANGGVRKEKVSISTNNIMEQDIVSHYDVLKEFGM